MSFKSISPKQLHEIMQSGRKVDLVDVRTPGEFRSVHAVGARSVPLNSISVGAVTAGRDSAAQGPTYVICKSGGRSRSACGQLVAEGMADVVNVDGGTSAWQAAGLPVEGSGGSAANWIRPAGMLAVVASLILSLTVNTNFAFAAMGVWLLMIVTGNAPCCAGSACSVPRGK